MWEKCALETYRNSLRTYSKPYTEECCTKRLFGWMREKDERETERDIEKKRKHSNGYMNAINDRWSLFFLDGQGTGPFSKRDVKETSPSTLRIQGDGTYMWKRHLSGRPRVRREKNAKRERASGDAACTKGNGNNFSTVRRWNSVEHNGT